MQEMKQDDHAAALMEVGNAQLHGMRRGGNAGM